MKTTEGATRVVFRITKLNVHVLFIYYSLFKMNNIAPKIVITKNLNAFYIKNFSPNSLKYNVRSQKLNNYS